MNRQKLHWTIYEIVETGFLASILFVQEQALTLLSNIQLTVLLIVLFSKTLGIRKTAIIVLIHVLLDNIVNNSLNIVYFPFMLIGWLAIPLSINTVFRKVNSSFGLALLGILYSLIYSWLFVIPYTLILKASLISYLASDVPFEILLALSSFLTIWWLYDPLRKVLEYSERSLKYRYK